MNSDMLVLFLLLIGMVGGYLLGGLNGSILLSKVFLKDDIRRHGSGNAGATNVLRSYGKGWTILVSLWDMGKGALAVWLGSFLLGGNLPAVSAADSIWDGYSLQRICCMASGLGVILGHVFPLFFGFRGGKGVFTALAVMLILDWQTACIALGFFFVTTLLTRYVSLGSMIAVFTLPFTALILKKSGEHMVMSIIVVALIVFLHKENIKRLLSGTENRFGEKKS